MGEKPNQAGKPMRQRVVSFNVLPIREERQSAMPAPTPILVDYSSIRERKQLNLSNFLQSDNPVTFILVTFWQAVCLFSKLFILPFILIKHFYLLLLQVHGVRRPTTSTTTSEFFSVSPTQSSQSQQRAIVWILTLIDYVIIQLNRIPDFIKQLINSTRKHIDNTVLKSFHLLDGFTSHQITKTYSMLKSLVFDNNDEVKLKTKR